MTARKTSQESQSKVEEVEVEPTTLLPVVSLLSLVTIEYGGWSLLGFVTKPDQLGDPMSAPGVFNGRRSLPTVSARKDEA